jgi:hypothetical protein
MIGTSTGQRSVPAISNLFADWWERNDVALQRDAGEGKHAVAAAARQDAYAYVIGQSKRKSAAGCKSLYDSEMTTYCVYCTSCLECSIPTEVRGLVQSLILCVYCVTKLSAQNMSCSYASLSTTR